jgi:hypothetical protein
MNPLSAYNAAMNTYRINWRSKLTGETGHGEAVLGKSEAHEIADRANIEHPELHHWVSSGDERRVCGFSQTEGAQTWTVSNESQGDGKNWDDFGLPRLVKEAGDQFTVSYPDKDPIP